MKLNDDRIILDKTLADQVSSWKSSRGLSDTVVTDHACSGETCSYYQIGDVFICEKTGQVHGGEHDLWQCFSLFQLLSIFFGIQLYPFFWTVDYNFCLFINNNNVFISFVVCDDTCREVIMDPTNELLVCTISGHCFDRLLLPAEMEPDAVCLA